MSDKFNEILDELRAMHDKKSKDYGTDGDAYANVRASAEFGVAPWIGALIRENDKTTRIKSFIAKGSLVNESLEDSLVDKAVYSIIALLLYREAQSKPTPITTWTLGHTWAFDIDKCTTCGLTGMQWENNLMYNNLEPCPGHEV